MGRNLLSPLDSDLRSYSVNAFDIETTGSNADFYMGSIVGDSTLRGKPEVYWDKREMLKEILSYRFRDGHMYAHNLEYDLMGVLDRDLIDVMGYDLEIFHNGANIIYGKVRDGNGHLWEFRDSQNIAPHMGVKDMGEILDLPKLDMDFDNRNVSDYSDSYVEKYNIRDSRIAYEFIKWFQNEINELGGNLHITAAKTAMKFFRRNYLKEPIEQPRKDLLETSYEGYYGGRTSPFTHGFIDGPLYSFDVASLYPYSMKKQAFPDTNNLHFDSGNRDNFGTKKTRVWEKEGMSEVTVKAPHMHKPVLPLRTEDKLLFPTGEFTAWQTHNELRFALERGYQIEDIDRQFYTRETINPFEDYVTDLFDKRLMYRDNDNPSEAIVKLLMNSLYGKFGQKMDNQDGGIYKPLDEMSIEDLDGKTVLENWVVEEPDREFIPNFINPLIASYVTARGRMELYKWIERAEREGGEVYYTDTDSIYTDVDLGVSSNKNLGGMDYEGEYQHMWIFGPKFYVVETTDGETKITAKGVPYSQMRDMWEAIQAGKRRIEYNKIASMREALRHGYKPNALIDRERSVDLTEATKRERVSEGMDILNEQIDTEPLRISLGDSGKDTTKSVPLLSRQ